MLADILEVLLLDLIPGVLGFVSLLGQPRLLLAVLLLVVLAVLFSKLAVLVVLAVLLLVVLAVLFSMLAVV